jgi:hypothetical protein
VEQHLAERYAEEHRTLLRENAPHLFKSLSESWGIEKHLHSAGERRKRCACI